MSNTNFRIESANHAVEYAEKGIESKVGRIAEQLRRMADDIVAMQARGGDDVLRTVGEIQAKVIWGMANAGVEDLARLAGDVLAARANLASETGRPEAAAE